MNDPDPTATGEPLSPGEREILIYVVDDESLIGEMVEVILKLRGFRPRFFTDPVAALQALREEEPKPDLLLTDFLMDPINGMELIDLGKRLQPSLKTILYTGNVGEEIKEHYAVQPDGFLSKPFLPKTLLAVVNSVLKRV